jgi:hypothetical protein
MRRLVWPAGLALFDEALRVFTECLIEGDLARRVNGVDLSVVSLVGVIRPIPASDVPDYAQMKTRDRNFWRPRCSRSVWESAADTSGS